MSMGISEQNVRLKRAYDRPVAEDGTRLWPRGLKKADAAIDQWLQDIAPSTALRKWFGHDPARWRQFRRRYAAEIHSHPEHLAVLRALARKGPITLVFSAHDELHNDAVVLKSILLGHRAR